MIETSFYSVLSSASSITAITGTRIYPLVVPTDAPLPAIDYTFIGGSSDGTFDGRGLAKWRVEVNCWGSTYGDAVNLRLAVIKLLDGYRDSNFVSRIIQPQDFFDHELLQYRAMVEFYLWFNV